MKQVKFNCKGYELSMMVDERAIHLDNTENLWLLLQLGLIENAEALAALILELFEREKGYTLNISEDSLVVEIWGHIYAEYFMDALQQAISLKLIDDIKLKIDGYCEVIDCGESAVDNNRFVWDILAPFKSIIASLLPKNIAYKKGNA